jgi:ABC-type Mn2+/Zn2+ transport system permease subunit
MPPEGASLLARFLAFPFYQHALFAGVAMAIACSVLSVFVVQRRMAFVGEGISHAAFGGIGVALLLEVALPPLRHPLVREAVVAVFCVGTAIVMGRLAHQRRVTADSAIGIALVVAMAIGVLLLDLRSEWIRALSARGVAPGDWQSYAPSYHDILFGNILSISREQTWLACGAAGAVVLWVALTFRGLVFYAADEEAAVTFGLPVGFLHYGLLTALGVTVVVTMQLLGVILVSALLILPGSIASFWSRRIKRVLGVAVLAGVLSIVLGLAAAMGLEVLSTGPVIVVVLALLFVASWALRGRR